MSHYSLIGATIVPSAVTDPFTFFDDSARRINASSRSGQFHSAIRSVLNAIDDHDCLRFLSAETATRKEESHDGITLFTLLEQSDIAVVENHLVELLEQMPDYIERLPDEVLTYWGGASDVRRALQTALDSGAESAGALTVDEGDSAEFFFSALKSMIDLLRTARDGSSKIIIYSWLPK